MHVCLLYIVIIYNSGEKTLESRETSIRKAAEQSRTADASFLFKLFS